MWTVHPERPFVIVDGAGDMAALAIQSDQDAVDICLAVNSHAALTKALLSLSNEVRGQYTIGEPAIRQALGNTNYQCVIDKLEAARAALVKAGMDDATQTQA